LARGAGVDPTARPEQLSVAEFAALARAFAALR
jgi:16S rRNA A1518/A1519 N6-dimethyltransferase RsmA/KsgA/DIM1 with predicted DNA glycosylase/AP lyase activity